MRISDFLPLNFLNQTPILANLPKECQKVKIYVEERGSQLFAYFRSNEGRENINLFVKAALAIPACSIMGTSFGTKGAVAGALFPPIFYIKTRCDKNWFNFENRLSQLKTLIKTIIVTRILVRSLTFAITATLLFTKIINPKDDLKGNASVQEFVKEFTEAGLQKLVYLIGAVIGPIIEEVAFRGFLMDVVYTLQQKWNVATINKTTQKITRIALQAIPFSLFHYAAENGIHNYYSLPTTLLKGAVYGYLMEKTSNVTVPLFYHSLNNFIAFYLQMNKS